MWYLWIDSEPPKRTIARRNTLLIYLLTRTSSPALVICHHGLLRFATRAWHLSLWKVFAGWYWRCPIPTCRLVDRQLASEIIGLRMSRRRSRRFTMSNTNKYAIEIITSPKVIFGRTTWRCTTYWPIKAMTSADKAIVQRHMCATRGAKAAIIHICRQS